MNEYYVKLLGTIFSFLSTFLVGALAYMFHNEIQRLKDVKEEKQKALKKAKEQLRDLLAENAEIRAFVHGNWSVSPVPVEDIQRQILQGEVKELVQDASLSELRQKVYDKYVGVHPDLLKELDYLVGKVGEQRIEGDGVWAELRKVVRSFISMVKEKDATIESLYTAREEAIRQAQERIRELEEEVRQKQKEVEEKKQEYASLLKYYERIVLKKLEERKERLDRVIAKLEETIKKRKEAKDLAVDGEVVAVSEELGYLWLDFGRKQGARRGLVFQVFEYVKGGLRYPKGKVEVVKVEEDLCQARVIELYRKDKPIEKGDVVVSPIFNRNQRKIFVFAGVHPVYRLYSVDRYRQMLEELNQIVENKVTEKTNFVVLLDGYENSPEYREALKYPWIIFLREDDLLEFLKH